MINKKLEYNTELMLITMEECGELIEINSKTFRCEKINITSKDDRRSW